MEAENAELRAALAAAMERIARLEKNSGNSSKPPSSDIVKASVWGASVWGRILYNV